MKQKRRKMLIVMSGIVVLGLAAALFSNLPKPVMAYDTAFDLMQIKDGSYLGNCDNGLVKVQVEVTVQNHAIANVQILKHDNGLGSAAEAITNEVLKHQSVAVDAISGATMSSKTILKAVEAALLKGQENK